MPKPSPETHFLRYRKTGEREELARSLELVAGELMSVALRRVGDREEARDLVQTTFVSAIEAADRFDAKARLFPWLRGILLNHQRQRRRTRRRRKELVADDLGEAPTPDPSDTTHRKLLLERIHGQVQKLPLTYREVLDLYVGRGWDSAEIASHLDRPHSTIRTQLSRGLEKLRAALPPGLAIGTIAYLAMRHGSEEVGTGTPTPLAAPRVLATGATLLAATAATLFVIPWGEDPTPVPTGSPVARGQKPAQPATVAPGDPVAGTTPAVRKPVKNTGSVRVRLTWASSGKPAAGISIRLAANNVPGIHILQSSVSWEESTSDANGVLVFENLPAGPAHLWLDDGQTKTPDFVVRPGGAVERHVSLTATGQCRGVVVGPDGDPVADAQVWLSTTACRGGPGYAAGVTGPRGEFRVPYFGTAGTIWARKAGYAASTMASLANALGTEVRLPLESDPGHLAGLVKDAEGSPVQNALVGIFPAPGDRQFQQPISYCRTARDGRFAVEDVQPGTYLIVANRLGMASAVRGPLEFKPGSRQHVNLDLTKGATVRGRVLSRRSPGSLGDLSVYCVPETDWLRYYTFGLLCRSSSVNEDGEYAVVGVPGGPVRLQVVEFLGKPTVRADDRLTITPGARHRWHLSLDPVLELLGRVQDEAGRPLAGIKVHLIPDEVPWDLRYLRAEDTDADGRFVFSGLQARPYKLGIVDIRTKVGVPSLVRRSVLPDKRPLAIILPSASRPSAWITGQLSARAAALWKEVVLYSESAENSWVVSVDPDTSTFRCGPLPPGGFAIRTRANRDEGTPGCVLASVQTEAGETHDLGQLDPGVVQKVSFQLARTDGRPILGGAIAILPEKVLPTPGLPLVNGKAETMLFPGDYVLWAVGSNFVPVEEPLSVQKGLPTVRGVRLQPARPCRFRFTVKGPQTGPLGKLSLRIYDASDKLVFTGLLPAQETDLYALDVGFPKGEYRVEARTIPGHGAAASFRVESVDGEPLTIEIPIRQRV